MVFLCHLPGKWAGIFYEVKYATATNEMSRQPISSFTSRFTMEVKNITTPKIETKHQRYYKTIPL